MHAILGSVAYHAHLWSPAYESTLVRSIDLHQTRPAVKSCIYRSVRSIESNRERICNPSKHPLVSAAVCCP